MWNPFAKKYYRRTHPPTGFSSGWSHELIELKNGVISSVVYRGLTFYTQGVKSWDHEGLLSKEVYLYEDYSGALSPISKEHFEMMWNMYHVTDKQN
jgi:hypothetical protein